MASRYIARKYGDSSEARSRTSSVVRESSSRATSQVSIIVSSFLLIISNISRFVTISPITPVEPQLLVPVAPPPLSGLLVLLTTQTKITTEGKQSLYMREILSSMTLYPLSPPPPPACTMQAT